MPFLQHFELIKTFKNYFPVPSPLSWQLYGLFSFNGYTVVTRNILDLLESKTNQYLDHFPGNSRTLPISILLLHFFQCICSSGVLNHYYSVQSIFIQIYLHIYIFHLSLILLICLYFLLFRKSFSTSFSVSLKATNCFDFPKNVLVFSSFLKNVFLGQNARLQLYSESLFIQSLKFIKCLI